MNLQTHIRPELWNAISSTYQAGNYSHAILDAMHYLSDVLREKSGVDGDGASLVGQALSIKHGPRLRINKLQTETERNIQQGMEQLLRGMYAAIRNPRSHEQSTDDQSTADAIIYFIDHLLGILDQSRERFTIQRFLDESVFDPDFVTSKEYMELLVQEIPTKKRTETLIEIWRRKHEGTREQLSLMVKGILEKLSQDEVDDYLRVVSEELRTTNDDDDIRRTLQILPPDLWPRISQIPRLRIENKLISYIRHGQGYYKLHDDEMRTRSAKGALATWSSPFLKHFTSVNEVVEVLIRKLHSSDPHNYNFVIGVFLSTLSDIIQGGRQQRRCLAALTAILKHDSTLQDIFWHYQYSLPESWREILSEGLKDLKNSEGKPIIRSLDDVDDIPF